MLKTLGVLVIFTAGLLTGRFLFSPSAQPPAEPQVVVKTEPCPTPIAEAPAPTSPPSALPDPGPPSLPVAKPKKAPPVPEPYTERQDSRAFVPMKYADVAVMGAIPGNTVIEYVEKHDPQIRQCYEREAEANPGIKGRLATEFVIGPGGRVKGLRVDRRFSDLRQPRLESCVLGIMRRMVFPEPTDGREVNVIYPLHFPKRAPSRP